MSILGDDVAGEGLVENPFNLGAFVFSGVFLVAHGRFIPFVMMLVIALVLPLLGGPGIFIATVVNFGISIYTGANGNQIAWETGRFATHEELKRSMYYWNIAALVVLGSLLVTLSIFLLI